MSDKEKNRGLFPIASFTNFPKFATKSYALRCSNKLCKAEGLLAMNDSDWRMAA